MNTNPSGLGTSLGLVLERTAAYRTDGRVTSITAAPTRAARGTDCEAALRALVAHGPMTDFELAARIDRQQTSAGVRRGDLVKHDPPLVEDTGAKKPSPSGRAAIVWGATAAGREYVRTGKRPVIVVPSRPKQAPTPTVFVPLGLTLADGRRIVDVS
jgi:hypothetical protein